MGYFQFFVFQQIYRITWPPKNDKSPQHLYCELIISSVHPFPLYPCLVEVTDWVLIVKDKIRQQRQNVNSYFRNRRESGCRRGEVGSNKITDELSGLYLENLRPFATYCNILNLRPPSSLIGDRSFQQQTLNLSTSSLFSLSPSFTIHRRQIWS